MQLFLESTVHPSLPLQVLASGEWRGLGGFARLHLSNETFITVAKILLCKLSELQSNLMSYGALARVLRTLGEKSGEWGQAPTPHSQPDNPVGTLSLGGGQWGLAHLPHGL